jgi:CNT family concentrative nucleoside transporter
MSTNHDSIEPSRVAVIDKAPGAAAIAADKNDNTRHDFPAHGHNPSTQQGVDENPDLTLHYSHEHQHKHLHHGQKSITARDHEDVLYAEGTTFDRSNIDDQGPQNYKTHHLRRSVDEKAAGYSDPEKGALGPARVESSEEGDAKKHRMSRTYSKYKIFVHLFIWLVFTG